MICGVEWPVFRQMIEKYRKWLEEQYGGIEKINERMVFAHNDVSRKDSEHRSITDYDNRLSTVIFSA